MTVTAPAGTGKSRLMEESVIRAGGGVNVATAQCLPYGAAVTFFPLRGLVRDLLGAAREEDALPRLREAFAGAGHEPQAGPRRRGCLDAGNSHGPARWIKGRTMIAVAHISRRSS